MYTSQEKDIIERCLAISFCNYKADKMTRLGRVISANQMRERVKKEIVALREVLVERPREGNLIQRTLRRVMPW